MCNPAQHDRDDTSSCDPPCRPNVVSVGAPPEPVWIKPCGLWFFLHAARSEKESQEVEVTPASNRAEIKG